MELDRGTEDQKAWRGKVEALAAWAIGPYKQAFANDTLTIAVVTPTAQRRDQLREWTHQELTRLGWAALGEIFLFTDVDPVTTSPHTFFFGRCWYEPSTTQPVSLLTPPALPQSAVPLVSPPAEGGVACRGMRLPWSPQPSLPLGTFWLGLRTLRLPVADARVHAHVLGKTGSGKSYFLASLFPAMQRAGMAATLIDPHGDLAELVLSHLLAEGRLDTPEQRRALIYLDLPAAAARGLFLPFNVLAPPFDDHAMAEHVAEAFRRAWPELATGAPTFENVLKHSVIALRQAGHPLTRLADLLADPAFRARVLATVTDPQVVRFFSARMDAWGRDAAVMKESTLNRADLLTLSPLLRYSLGAADTALPFRRILDTGTSVLINLAVPSPDARRLLGCLLTVGLEAAALSRADVPAAQRVPHHLILDEFSQFLAQSEESLTRMLSETRKYALFCVMAHQNWSQASERLKGALQNVGLEINLKAGRADAEYSSRLLGAVDPMSVKHTVENETAVERTHPTFFPLLEQWEQHAQAIQRLRVGEAFVRLPSDTVRRVATPTLPRITVASERLAAVREHYLHAYFRPCQGMGQPSGESPISTSVPSLVPAAVTTREPPLIRRYHPDEPAGQPR